MLIVKFAKEFFRLVSTIQITPLTHSLCSAAQSDRLPPPGSIRRDPCVVPTAGSCLAPSMTLTALLCVGCATFTPCFSLSPSQTFLSLLLQPSYEGKAWGCPHHLPHGEGNTVANVSTSFLALVWKDKCQVRSWRHKASLANPSLQDIPKDGMLVTPKCQCTTQVVQETGSHPKCGAFKVMLVFGSAPNPPTSLCKPTTFYL